MHLDPCIDPKYAPFLIDHDKYSGTPEITN